MKASLLISVLILAVAAGFGWQGQRELAAARETHERLVVEAEELGYMLDPENPTQCVRAPKLAPRVDREEEAAKFAGEFAAFAVEMEAAQKSGGEPDQEAMRRMMEFMNRMGALDADQIKQVIAALKSNPELSDEMRTGMVMFAMMSLADSNPRAALTLFTESSDLFPQSGMNGHMISSAVAKWAEDDPVAAVKWLNENAKKHPDLLNEEAKAAVLKGAAFRDPLLALGLIGDLGMESKASALGAIAQSAGTERRDELLEAMRKYVAELPAGEAQDGMLQPALQFLAFGYGSPSRSFAEVSGWIDSAGLSTDEVMQLTGSIAYSIKLEDAGEWIGWLGESGMKESEIELRARQLAERWTNEDFRAAGEWLTTAPDGVAKQAAVRAYAERVFPYDREAAIGWALTLPEGADRVNTLTQLYESWPKGSDEDRAAAEAFAEEHGIEIEE